MLRDAAAATAECKKQEVLKDWKLFKTRWTHQFVDGCCNNQDPAEQGRSLR